MKINNRYKFVKEMYPNYIIFVKKRDTYHTYFIDNKICRLLNINKIKDIKKYKINYIMLDNLEIVCKCKNEINNYNKYIISYLVNEIGSILKERII